MLETLAGQLAYPLNAALWLGLLALALHHRRAGAGLVTVVVALGWLLLWSLPPIADAVHGSLANRYPVVPVPELPSAQAIVLVGGGMPPVPADWPQQPRLYAGADRVYHAAHLFHAGKAPVILVTGGHGADREGWLSEARAMEQLLRDLGVPAESILLEEQSMSTRQNAVFTREMLAERGLERVLVVTSAHHMPRALGSFGAVEVEAVPAPTDLSGPAGTPGQGGWLPSAEALARSTRAIREHLAYRVYRWRGWLQ